MGSRSMGAGFTAIGEGLGRLSSRLDEREKARQDALTRAAQLQGLATEEEKERMNLGYERRGEKAFEDIFGNIGNDLSKTETSAKEPATAPALGTFAKRLSLSPTGTTPLRYTAPEPAGPEETPESLKSLESALAPVGKSVTTTAEKESTPEGETALQKVNTTERNKPGFVLTTEYLLSKKVPPVGKYGEKLYDIAKQNDKIVHGGSGGFSGWKEKQDQRDEIAMMPEGEEKDAAIKEWEMRWATSTALSMTPEYREAMGLKARETAEGGVTGKAIGETSTGERATDYRKEFNDLPEVKSIKTLYANSNKANKAYEDYKAGKVSSYGVDQSLGYFASKALDPNSVVMPGEFDRFAKGLGVAEGAQALSNQLISGGLKLTDSQRDEMIRIVNNSMDGAREATKGQYDYYSGLAKKRNLDPDEVVGGIDYIMKSKKDIPSFATEAEAEASGIKGEVIIAGRKAVIK